MSEGTFILVVGLVFVVTYSIVILSIPKRKKQEPVVEYRWENDDKEKQIVEYNKYVDGIKTGRTVRFSYFTEAQMAEHHRIAAEIYKRNSHQGH